MLADLIFLNSLILSGWMKNTTANVHMDTSPTPKNVQAQPLEVTSLCPSSCLEEIAKVASASTQILSTEQAPAPVVSLPVRTAPTISFIPLGTGSTTNNEWTDVAGAEAWIDTNDYGAKLSVYFEAGIRVSPNGEITARLYNVTDKHPVWNSEVRTSSGQSITVQSERIQFDSGKKLYRVQLQSTLQYPASLDAARIRIEQR